MSVDYNKAFMLLSVVDKAKNWPNLQGLHDLAMNELQDTAKKAGEELAKIRAEAKAKADEEAAKAKADADAVAKKLADEEARNQKLAADNAARQDRSVGAGSITTSDAERRL